MTLIVGLHCTDGVVIGSDSAITFTAGAGIPTIAQTSLEKINIVDDHVIVVGSSWARSAILGYRREMLEGEVLPG